MRKFEWDFSSLDKNIQQACLDIKNGIYNDNTEFAFHIALVSPYKWGKGWTASEADRFKDELRDSIKEVFGKTMRIDDERIVNVSNSCGFYPHPMDIAGYGTKSDIEKLHKVFNKMSCVASHRDTFQTALYPLSVTEYENLIADNFPALKKWFAVYDLEKSDLGKRTRMADVGMTFAEKNRLPIINYPQNNVDGVLNLGRSSFDPDINLICSLYRAYQAEKEYEKNKDKVVPKEIDTKDEEELER